MTMTRSMLRASAPLRLLAAGAAAVAAQSVQGRGAAMQQRIEMIDADGDGVVQRAELEAWRETVFLTIDADGDGSVTRAAFTAYAVEQLDAADANDDGALAAPEFRAMHGRP
jgi:hypothetical protein